MGGPTTGTTTGTTNGTTTGTTTGTAGKTKGTTGASSLPSDTGTTGGPAPSIPRVFIPVDAATLLNLDFGVKPRFDGAVPPADEVKAGPAAVGAGASDRWNRLGPTGPMASDIEAGSLVWANGDEANAKVALENLPNVNRFTPANRDPMLATYASSAPGTAQASVTVEGLPQGTYEIYAYSDTGAPDQNMGFTVSVLAEDGAARQALPPVYTSLTNPEPPGWAPGAQYAALGPICVSAGSDRVRLDIASGAEGTPGASAVINGLQVVRTATGNCTPSVGPVVLASNQFLGKPGQTGPWLLALSGGEVFWTNQTRPSGRGSLSSVPIGGGPTTTLSDPGPDAACQPWGLAVDSSRVYWSTYGASCGVMSKQLDAEGSSVIVDGLQQLGSNAFVAAAGDSVFWGSYAGFERVGADGSPRSGLGGSQLFAAQVTVDAANVYWIDDGQIFTAPLQGGSITRLASGPAGLFLAQDDKSLYWTDLVGGRVFSISKEGGDPAELARGQRSPMGIAVDSTSVYWANAGDGTVMSLPKGGGEAKVVAVGQGQPTAVAVDSNSLYWTNFSDGTVVQLTPK